MIKKRVLPVLALMLGTTLVQASSERLTLLTESYPPFNMSIDDRNFARGDGIDGISTDIVREVMRRADMEYSLTLRFPWSRVFNMARDRKNFGVFSTVRSAERERLFKWVGPLVADDFVAFTLPGSSVKVNSVNDLKNYRVGAYKGDYVAEMLRERNIPVIEALQDNSNATKLVDGRIDLWVSGSTSGPYAADQVGVRGLQQVFTIENQGLYLALNKSTPDDVVTKLQAALDTMRSDGTLEEIHNRYR